MKKIVFFMHAMGLTKRRASNGLILLMFCMGANASTPSESAQLSIFATSKALELAAKVCEKQNSKAAALLLRYQQVFSDQISAALTKGRQLAAQRKQNFDDELNRLAQEQLIKFGATNQSCDNGTAEIEKSMGWTFQHYLDREYVDWMRQVGNAIGYPCEWSHDLGARAVKGFLERGVDFSDAKLVLRSSLLLETDHALKVVSLCERAQARAPEFGVTAVLDYRDIKQALSLVAKSLRLLEPDRQTKLEAAFETLRSYPGSQLK